MELRDAVIQRLIDRKYTSNNDVLTVVPTQVNECDEDKEMEDKLQDWSTIDSLATIFDDDDKIFHPDDEIILDPKESSEAPIARVILSQC